MVTDRSDERSGSDAADQGERDGGRLPLARRGFLAAQSLALAGAAASGGVSAAPPSGDSGVENTVAVSPGDRTDLAVSDQLFGRLCEHYEEGTIYPGVYSEHVKNNSFYPRSWSEEDYFGPKTFFDPASIPRREGVPFPWEPVEGSGGSVGFELGEGGVAATETTGFQRVTLDGGRGGIGQKVVLPDFRTLGYDLSVSVRGAGVETVTVALKPLREPSEDTFEVGETLATADVDVTGEWEREEVTLELDSAAGDPYVAGAIANVDTPYGEYYLEFTAGGSGHVDLDWVMLAADDAVRGKFNPSTVELMRDQDATWLKWPGGNFTSQYNWRDGVGPLAERESRFNHAWGGVDPNYFGTDEYLELCEVADLTPHITVGWWDYPPAWASERQILPADAADWVEYCNGEVGDDTADEGTYQLDFVVGDPETELGESDDDFYGRQERLVQYAHAERDAVLDRDTWINSLPEDVRDAVTADPIEVEDGTASVSVTVTEGEELTLSLVGYTLPDGEFSFETADEQTVVGSSTATLGAGEHTLEIDVPRASMADLRAEHGHPETYDVEYWGVGNEVYGPWQRGSTADPAEYAAGSDERIGFDAYADAMREADDSITVYASGMDPMYEEANLPDPDEWNSTLFDLAGDRLDGLNVHRYNWGIESQEERDAWYEANEAGPVEYNEVLIMFPTQFGVLMEELGTEALDYGLDDFEINVSEYGLFPTVDAGAPYPGPETMPGGSYIAGMLNAFIRHSEFVRAASQTWVPVRMFPPAFVDFPSDPNPLAPAGAVFGLYSEMFRGDAEWHAVGVETTGAGRTIPETGPRIRRMEDVPYVDAAAMRAAGDGDLCVFATNRNLWESSSVTLSVGDEYAGESVIAVRMRTTSDERPLPHLFGTSWTEPTNYETVTEELSVGDDGSVTLDLDPASVARLYVGDASGAAYDVTDDGVWHGLDAPVGSGGGRASLRSDGPRVGGE
ncbi:alpha-L-arabinofuranosidase [Candidatus Halobonum tyrrellensis]|uniref:Alpha-L-arabinofuranosidase domain protein n=1 Tax=Candidatus Halobonum tyrrellensis G22 TaxID=1324957 RepID=V4J1S3_9EURY|nr:alpha-L-arabinofuranosidase [Candidatus Halobonum tyrrellensis]ESP89362.1 alpha-L-arabinofuranosidase domain protein [Candidatus Halobonum tyrrellensis G22]